MVHSPQVIDLHCLKLLKIPFVNISEHILHFNEGSVLSRLSEERRMNFRFVIANWKVSFFC